MVYQFASGVIPIISVGTDDVTLLLRDGVSNQWFPPKGLVDGDESLIACALREFREETGASLCAKALASSPYTIRYSPNAGTTKHVALFLAEFTDGLPPIRLSPEHCEYRWVPLSAVPDIVGHEESRVTFEEVVRDRNHARAAYSAQRATRLRIVEGASRSLPLLADYGVENLYLTGSWSSFEATISNRECVSDIDLVTYAKRVMPHESRKHVWRVISEFLGEVVPDAAQNGCGIFFLDGQSRRLRRDIFWSYFCHRAIPIGTSPPLSTVVECIEPSVCVPDFVEEAYGLLWYRLSRAQECDDLRRAYSYAKGLMLTPVLLDPTFCQYEFLDYSTYRANLFEKAQLLNSRYEISMLAVIRAIDWKLNARGPISTPNPSQSLSAAISLYLEQQDSWHKPVRTVLEALNNYVSTRESPSLEVVHAIETIVGLHLPHSRTICLHQGLSAEFCTLMFMAVRLICWGHRLGSSLFKYKAQAKALLLRVTDQHPEEPYAEIRDLLDRALLVAEAKIAGTVDPNNFS